MNYLSMPYQRGKLNFHNRLMLPPLVTNKAGADGEVTEELLEYYDQLTSGGYFAAAIIENAFISANGKFDRRQLSIEHDEVNEGLAKLAKTVQRNGTKCILQINHAGIRANEANIGSLPIGPSEIFDAGSVLRARAIDRGEIADLVGQYQAAALRAQEAGFDGVEIHAAHGFLLNQFYSPLINKRKDEYGGTLLNRIRFLLEVIKAIREVRKDGLILSLRLGACDYMEGGTTIRDSEEAALELEKAGVDLLSISGGLSGFTVPGDNSQGYFSPLSSAIKRRVAIPVLLTGGITEPVAANCLLRDQKADFIGIGRAILKNKGWGKLALVGNWND
jgi:2,4-dienoyl-CoA reductase-like NADH-dependent reductase (Old Yellow Enzyme family)